MWALQPTQLKLGSMQPMTEGGLGVDMCPPSHKLMATGGKRPISHLGSLLSISESIPKPIIVTEIWSPQKVFSEVCGKGHHGELVHG